MISLEQIRSLESKVYKTVELMSVLQAENKLLKNSISKYEVRIEELEYMIEEFKDEQTEIEKGIISALTHLDSLEDAVGGLKQPTLPASGFVETAHISEPAQSGSDFVEDNYQNNYQESEELPQSTTVVEVVEEDSDVSFEPQDQQLDIF